MTCSISAAVNRAVERRHRGAVQTILDRAAEIVAVGLGAAGRRGELEDPLAIIAGQRIQKRGRRPIAGPRNAMAVEAVPAVNRVPPPGLRLHVRVVGEFKAVGTVTSGAS